MLTHDGLEAIDERLPFYPTLPPSTVVATCPTPPLAHTIHTSVACQLPPPTTSPSGQRSVFFEPRVEIVVDKELKVKRALSVRRMSVPLSFVRTPSEADQNDPDFIPAVPRTISVRLPSLMSRVCNSSSSASAGLLSPGGCVTQEHIHSCLKGHGSNNGRRRSASASVIYSPSRSPASAPIPVDTSRVCPPAPSASHSSSLPSSWTDRLSSSLPSSLGGGGGLLSRYRNQSRSGSLPPQPPSPTEPHHTHTRPIPLGRRDSASSSASLLSGGSGTPSNTTTGGEDGPSLPPSEPLASCCLACHRSTDYTLAHPPPASACSSEGIETDAPKFATLSAQRKWEKDTLERQQDERHRPSLFAGARFGQQTRSPLGSPMEQEEDEARSPGEGQRGHTMGLGLAANVLVDEVSLARRAASLSLDEQREGEQEAAAAPSPPCHSPLPSPAIRDASASPLLSSTDPSPSPSFSSASSIEDAVHPSDGPTLQTPPPPPAAAAAATETSYLLFGKHEPQPPSPPPAARSRSTSDTQVGGMTSATKKLWGFLHLTGGSGSGGGGGNTTTMSNATAQAIGQGLRL